MSRVLFPKCKEISRCLYVLVNKNVPKKLLILILLWILLRPCLILNNTETFAFSQQVWGLSNPESSTNRAMFPCLKGHLQSLISIPDFTNHSVINGVGTVLYNI